MPRLGETVIYRSKIDNGGAENDVLSPAIVVRTRNTTRAAVIERWGALPVGETMTVGTGEVTHETGARPAGLVLELDDDNHVDLYVLGLGKPYYEYNVARGNERGQWQLPGVVPEPL